jgi:hypothetical protein
MRPLTSKFFGNNKNKLAVKFHDGSSVVTGYIVKQLGNVRFLIQKDSTQAIRQLAQTAAEVAAVTGGDTKLCVMEFTPFGSSTPVAVRGITSKVLIGHDGNRYSYVPGIAAANAAQATLVGIPNIAPTVATPVSDITVTKGTLFSYAIPSSTFVDLDGDALIFTAAKVDGSALPTWMSFSPSTLTLAGTPAVGDVGVTTVRITATDGTATAFDDFTVTVS